MQLTASADISQGFSYQKQIGGATVYEHQFNVSKWNGNPKIVSSMFLIKCYFLLFELHSTTFPQIQQLVLIKSFSSIMYLKQTSAFPLQFLLHL